MPWLGSRVRASFPAPEHQLRRVSKAVMQRIANSSSPVQLWNAPPLKTSFYPPLLLSPSAIFNCFNSYKWNYCFCLTLVLLLLSQSNFFSFSSLSSFFSVRGRNFVPPICNSQLFVLLVVIFLLHPPSKYA